MTFEDEVRAITDAGEWKCSQHWSQEDHMLKYAQMKADLAIEALSLQMRLHKAMELLLSPELSRILIRVS